VIVAARFLLDTNILSDLIRHPQGRIAERLIREGEGSVCTSIIVASELRFGAAKCGSPRLNAQSEEVLSALDILPFEEPADRRYGELRDHLERQGTPIGPNDMLIAAHALALRLAVVTDNVREFSRVPGLSLENWLAP
jgi:tRNA(fMet)-specific endonuclease VapC